MSDFEKLPPGSPPSAEDADGDGLTERPSVRWLLWCSDAVTTFCNGFFAGFGTAAVVGGASAANTDSFNPQTLSWAAALGFLVTAAANGLKHVVIWHDSHPMPNPFRPS